MAPMWAHMSSSSTSSSLLPLLSPRHTALVRAGELASGPPNQPRLLPLCHSPPASPPPSLAPPTPSPCALTAGLPGRSSTGTPPLRLSPPASPPPSLAHPLLSVSAHCRPPPSMVGRICQSWGRGGRLTVATKVKPPWQPPERWIWRARPWRPSSMMTLNSPPSSNPATAELYIDQA